MTPYVSVLSARAAALAAMALALSACRNEQEPEPEVPQPCPTAQDATGYPIPSAGIGQIGQSLSVTLPSPNRDDCTGAVTAVAATVTDPSGATVASTAEMKEISPSAYPYGQRKLVGGVAAFTPVRWGWHTVRLDFGEVGGQAEAKVFVADGVAPSEILPFNCGGLQRGRTGWLCDEAYVRGVTTVATFPESVVGVVDDALWIYDFYYGYLSRSLDTGSGDLVQDPPGFVSVPRFSYYGPKLMATREDAVSYYGSTLELYRAHLGSISRVASIESPLLSNADLVQREGDWIYVVRGGNLVYPFFIDQANGAFVPKEGFTAPGTLVDSLGNLGLLTVETVGKVHLVRRLALRDGVITGETRMELPALLGTWSVEVQSIWRLDNWNVKDRYFALLRDGDSLRLGELALPECTSSSCSLGVRRSLLYWRNGSTTEVLFTP